MSFTQGFTKHADVASGLAAGLKSAGKETVKDALLMKGLRDAVHSTKDAYKGRMKDLFKTTQGREHLAEMASKSLPSLAAGTLYGKAALKSYKALKSQSENSYDQYY